MRIDVCGYCVPPENVTALHNELKKILPARTSKICVVEHLNKDVDKLVGFMSSYAVIVPHNYLLRKCNKADYCGQPRSPVENGMSILVLQR